MTIPEIGAPGDPRVFTVDEVGAVLRVHRQKVCELIHTGRLRAIRMGEGLRAPYRIPRSALEEFLEGSPNERAPACGEGASKNESRSREDVTPIRRQGLSAS